MAIEILEEEGLAGSAGQSASYFRRRISRVEAGESVYAFWSCDGRDGLSRVRDLSMRGLFIESPLEEELGAPVNLYFLANEGQIRASAEVRHVRRGRGLGLKFIAIDQKDCQRLAGLLQRVRTSEVGTTSSSLEKNRERPAFPPGVEQGVRLTASRIFELGH